MNNQSNPGIPLTILLLLILLVPCGTHAQDVESPGSLPDPDGWGTHVLAAEVAPDGSIWVGTYGQGIYVNRDGEGRDWERLTSDDPDGISWDFVHAFAFPDGEVWYGTIGNGWGVSRDGGQTWRNWTFRDLGPRWQYVAPGGIAASGDAVYIATADGLRITKDGGETYRDVTETSALPNKYILGLELEPDPAGPPVLRLFHLRGVSESRDGGHTWDHLSPVAEGRSLADQARNLAASAAAPAESLERLRDLLANRHRAIPDPGGPVVEPADRHHFWFQRPVSTDDNPYTDQTYSYGSTMGGNFQQHQGVEFNVPEGTPIHAIGDGVVRLARQAEAGSNTIAIRHDRALDGAHVWSTYYHNSRLVVEEDDRVVAGQLIAYAGNTGRATNDHLHLEIHVTPADETDVRSVVDPDVRYPPHTHNPLLWIEPLSGTGVIAGRVFSSDGTPVPGARVYGVTKPEPRETPFSFAETYEDRTHPDPVFGEHFVIGDVPPGVYVLGTEIDGQRIYHKVRVAAGKITQVEFTP